MDPTVYGDIILWERPIQFWAEKIIKNGDDVLDVGANVGGLAIAFARMVGASGRVVAVEANAVMGAHIENDMAVNGITNVTLVRAAAYHTGGETRDFFIDPSFYSSQSALTPQVSNTKAVSVETVTLDAICLQHNLRPRLIKLDIEGAELDALKGAETVLRICKPFLICECGDTDEELLTFVQGHGYRCFDVNTLDVITPASVKKFSEKRNFVAVPKGKILTPCFEPRCINASFLWGNILSWLKNQIRLLLRKPPVSEIFFNVRKAGDYRVEVKFSYDSDGAAAFHLYDAKGTLQLMYAAQASHLADESCRLFPIHLSPTNGPYRLVLSGAPQDGDGLSLHGVTLVPFSMA